MCESHCHSHFPKMNHLKIYTNTAKIRFTTDNTLHYSDSIQFDNILHVISAYLVAPKHKMTISQTFTPSVIGQKNGQKHLVDLLYAGVFKQKKKYVESASVYNLGWEKTINGRGKIFKNMNKGNQHEQLTCWSYFTLC